MKRRPLILAVLPLAFVLAACATSVTGSAKAGSSPMSALTSSTSSNGQLTTPSSKPVAVSSSTVSTASSTPTPTTSAPSSSSVTPFLDPTVVSSPTNAPPTSQTVSRKTTLNCGAGAITTKGAPFCYHLPAGFKDVSSSTRFPGTDPVRTAVAYMTPSGPASLDLVMVTSSTLAADSDGVSDQLIKASLQAAYASGTDGVSSFSPITEITVAGDRAFQTNVKYTSGDQKRYLLIFSGNNRLEVSCQWHSHQAPIATGCNSVLASLQIAHS